MVPAGPGVATLPEEVVDANDFRLRVRNHGKTPAHDMIIEGSRVRQEELPNDAQFRLTMPGLAEAQMLHPNQVHVVRYQVDPLFCWNSDTFYVYGRITYKDIYDRWWITEFCYLYGKGDTPAPVGPHNHEGGPFKVRPASRK